MTDRRGGNRLPLDLFAPSALVATGAAVLGWVWFFGDRPFWLSVGVVLGAATVGVVAAMALAGPRPRSPAVTTRRDIRGPAVDGWWSSQQTASRPPAPDRRPSEPPAVENAQLVLPVDEVAPAGPWWGQGSSAPRVRAPAPARRTPRDLAELRDSARVVQCPRCGGFRIDVTHVDPGFAFRCRVDDHEWTWRPGTAWPVTVVASRRRADR